MKVSPDFFDSNSDCNQLQTDLEEAKGHEILKLQNSLQSIHAIVHETYALLTKERESAQKAVEETSAIVQETAPIHVEDTEKIDKLSAEVEKLKASRETGALQEANDRLQKQVEGLTWRLRLAKHVKTDLEEAQGQEILNLQNSLQAKVDETNALLTKERESAQKKIYNLSAEVEELKSLLESERNRANESEKKCTEALETIEIKQQKLEETVKRTNQLQETLIPYEEKMSDLVEEERILRPLLFPKTTKIPVDSRIPSMRLITDTDVKKRPQKSLNEKQQHEYLDLLIQCITQHLGFSKGRPVAACIIYKCLRDWRCFELEKTNIFDRIINTIFQAIEKQYNNNEVLAYWLSNASTLLLLLQRPLKASGTGGAPQYRTTTLTTFFGRMTQSFLGTPQGVNISLIDRETDGASDTLHQVEAKYPAVIFNQQLIAYAEKIYRWICYNLKEQIFPLLELCIQAPRSLPNLIKITETCHWQEILNKFDSFLHMLTSNNMPPFLVRKIFMQNFSFINARLFNSVFLRQECCSFSNGEYVKAGLSELEHWCYKATEKYVGSAWDELKHIRQAVRFLVMRQNPKKTLEEIHEMCPILNMQQLCRMNELYWDDRFKTQDLSPDVIFITRVPKMDYSDSRPFLLDEDSRLNIPFTADELSKSMDEMDIENVESPPLLRANSGFSFLS